MTAHDTLQTEGYWLKESRVTPRSSQTGSSTGCYLVCSQPLKGSPPPHSYHPGDLQRTAIWEAQGSSACLRPAPSLFSSPHFPGAFSSSPRKTVRWEYPHRGSPTTQRGWPFQNTWKTISQLCFPKSEIRGLENLLGGCFHQKSKLAVATGSLWVGSEARFPVIFLIWPSLHHEMWYDECWSPNPKGDSVRRWAFGKWLGHEGSAFITGINVLIRETLES